MRKTLLIRPDAADRFKCIGPACEDSCCKGWAISVDELTYEKYRNVPAGPLRTLLDANVLRCAPDAQGAPPQRYAQINIGPERLCPMLTDGDLCRIQVELGADFLSTTCATFPRRIQIIDDLEERPLTLSCPEAARLVLLDPHPLGRLQRGGPQLTWDNTATSPQPLRSYFWPIRSFAVTTLLDRTYPLWQRMFLLGTFCRRLDAIAHGEIARPFPAFLSDFEAAVRAGSLRAAMETIPADLHLQLDLVLRMVQLGVNGARRDVRFRACLEAFTEGIGHQPAAPPESQVAHYKESYERYYAPFFAAHPHILENYLVNLVFWELFPFGRDHFQADAAPEIAKAFMHLAIQFALIKGVLIGVAGSCKEAFSVEHVVHAVQTVTKQFEHNAVFLANASALLAERQMDNAHGLTMLLRN